MFLRNVGVYQVYTASQPRRTSSPPLLLIAKSINIAYSLSPVVNGLSFAKYEERIASFEYELRWSLVCNSEYTRSNYYLPLLSCYKIADVTERYWGFEQRREEVRGEGWG
jgi:hypothetical protein